MYQQIMQKQTSSIGYIYSIETPNNIKADIPVKYPFYNKQRRNAILALTNIKYSSNSIHLFGRPSQSNLHHFQSISVMKSIQLETIDSSANQWFERMNARGISSTNIILHDGRGIELVFVTSMENNERSTPSELECKMHDRMDELMDSAILF
ncbi:hypothetical protein K501DRAFT_331023 [Backusella circina FSU 941]|nr:hypothetical protein K501DRAFT_331023 [Backusella circina FSU 941]